MVSDGWRHLTGHMLLAQPQIHEKHGQDVSQAGSGFHRQNDRMGPTKNRDLFFSVSDNTGNEPPT